MRRYKSSRRAKFGFAELNLIPENESLTAFTLSFSGGAPLAQILQLIFYG